jgi:hypothetical protein
MSGPRSHQAEKAWRTASRAVAHVLMMVVAVAAFAAPTSAQVKVHYGEGQYGAYRKQLGDFGSRAGDLIDEIGQVDVDIKYCTPAERAAVGKRLAALRTKVNQLRQDWTQFKQGIEMMVESQGVMRQFIDMDENPKDPNFWANADKEVVQHPLDDLNAKQMIWNSSKVVDCSPPKTAARSPAPTDPPPPPKKDPLAGLTRPNLKPQTLPPPPKAFCSEEERWAWVKKVIIPLMDENIDASTALRNYGGDVWDRLSAARSARPVDQDAVDKLDSELQWEFAEHKKWDDVFQQIKKLEKSAIVVDCTQRTATGPVPIPVDSLHPGTLPPRGGAQPPVDTTHPRAQERPGTGAPPAGTEPPKTGALPGGKRHSGGWYIGFGVDESWYQDFAHTAGDQQNIDTFTGGQTAPGWGVDLGFAQSGWRLWACRHVNTLHYTQHYMPGSPFSRIDGDLNGSFYDMRLGRDVGPFWNTYVEVYGGVTFAYDKLEFRPVTPLGASLGQNTRTLDTWKTNFGLAIDRPLSSDFGLRLNATYTSAGKSNDADLNLRFGAGLTYKLPGNFGF